MDFGGRYLLTADRLAVWSALNDPAVLKASIPGCTRIDWVDAARLEAAIAINLGVAKPEFTGELELSNLDPAVSYTLTGRGRGMLGRVEAAADVTLNDHPDGTVLAFTAEGHASSSIMKIGRALLGAQAQKIIDRFMERFATAMDSSSTPLDGEE